MVAAEIGKEMIRMEAVIVEILQAVGVYDGVKKKVTSDEELARLFDQDFEELIRLVSK
jgi:hypothetical protein